MAISDLPEGDLSAAASVPAEGSNEAKPRRVSVTKLAAVLHPLVQPEVVPDPAGLHVGVSEGFLESRAGSVSGQDLVVMLHPMADAVSAPPPPPPEAALTFAAPDTATAGVSFDATITNTGGTASAAWSLNVPSGWTVTPSSGVAISAGATVTVAIVPTAGSQDLVLTSATPVTGSPQSVVVSGAPVLPTTATLSGSSSATTDVAHTSRVTLDAAADQTYTITWTRSNSGTGSATSTITAGNTYVEATDTWGAAGSGRTVDFTISPSLTRAGRPLSVTVSDAVPGGTPGNFTLTSSASGTLPFALGLAFRQGDIPAGSDVAFSGATAKASILSTWPDGSARIALAAGTYTSAGSAVTVTPSAGSNAAGTALTGASVQSAMGANTAVIGCGSYGTATFSGADFASPFKTHAATSAFGEFIYRKAVGSDAHLVAWIAVRLWASGAVEVLPWIENGFLNVASPTSKSATFAFSLGGSSRFSAAIDLPAHCRAPLVSGATLAHWLGTDPGVTGVQDRAYLQATEQVPSYFASIDPASSLITGLPATFTPLQQGSFDYSSDLMQSTGYASPIGLLPQHDALYLMTTADIGATVERNGYSAGRYPIHWRDESTNRPPVFSAYPHLVIGSGQGITNTGTSSTGSYTPAVSGTSAPPWDLAHCPSVGYLAYLLTGRFFHMETAQFAAVANHFHQGDDIRSNGSGVIRSYPGANDTRHAAWGIRTLWQALAVTPDSDTTQRNNFKASLQATIDFHHARYVAQSHNPLGFTEPGTDYLAAAGAYGDRLWMQDFSVGSWGYLKAALPALDAGYAAKVSAFFTWHAPATVGRLGDPDDSNAWPINNPAHYTGAVAASDTPDWSGGTGPWYSTFRAAYNATIATPPGWLSTNKLVLGAEILPGANSFLGNLLPAIAYAVRHGVSGAQAAYRRLMAMQGFGLLVQDLQNYAVWGIKPASGALPTWLTAGTFAWQSIPNSTLAGSAAGIGSTPGDSTAATNKLLAYSGISKRGTEVWTIATGGHNDSADNGARKLDIGVDSPAWVLAKASDWNGSESGVAYYAAGSPASRHAHRSTFWVPQRSRFLLLGCRATYGGSAVSYNDVASFNPANNGYDAAGTRAAPLCAINAFDPATGIGVGSYTSSGGQIVRFDAAADTHTVTAGGSIGYMPTGAYDSKRGQFYYLGWGDGEAGGTGIVSRKVSSNGVTVTNITLTGAGATAFASAAPSYGTMVYDPVVDCFWWWDGASRQLFKIVPDAGTSWACTVQSISGTQPVAAQYSFSRMEYVSELGGLVFMPTGVHPMHFVRTI